MSWKKCINRGGCLYETIQAIRWIPVIIVIAACSWGYYAYVYQLSIVTVDNWFQRIIYIVVFHILLILLLWSYFKTILTPPGKPPPEFCFEGEALIEINDCRDDERRLQAVLQRYTTQRKLPIRIRGYDNSIRFCEKCKCIKPDRSHHCSMCGHCILKFDHHCPWVNNCVNFSNYKFFLLFLGYGFTFCLWILFTDLPYFIDFWKMEFSAGVSVQNGKFHILFLVFVSAMFALSLSALFFYHLYLTAKNRSTVESFRAPMIDGRYEKNAYNNGIRANYREVFGVRKELWIFPIFSTIGSGVEFDLSWNRVATISNGHMNNGDRGIESIEIGGVPSMTTISGEAEHSLESTPRSGFSHAAQGPLISPRNDYSMSNSVFGLQYTPLRQQEEEEVEMQNLYSDDEDGEVDLNVNIV